MAFFKKSFVFGAISFATMGLVACGESSDSKSDASGVVDIIDESKAELSDGEVVTCDSELEGAVAAIVTGGFRRCEDGAWVKISRAEALEADKILGMGGVSSALSSSSLDVSSSSSWSGAIGSTEDSEKGSTDFVVDREKDMPVCSAKREGKTIYVEELDETFVCLDFEWVKKGASSSSSSSALSSSSWSEAIGSSDSDPVTELYKCPNGQYTETKEECPSSSGTKQSSSSVNGASSASTLSSSSASSSSSWSGAIGSKPAEVMPSGYYSNSSNCPAGLTCKYATTTEYLNSSKTYGEVLDTRDGQVYKTIVICDKNDKNCQTWMAQNLNYALDPEKVSSMGDYAWSGCYENESANCSKYGRLYTWEVAMDKADCGFGTYCSNRYEGTQGICPSGWHLPSHYEFEKLINFIDPTFGYSHTDEASSSTAGKYLKSLFSWNSSGNGTDFYGFSALPGGYRDYDGDFYSAGIYALFWSSGEYGSDYALYLGLRYDYETADLFGTYKNFARSVRCLKDIPDQGGEISSSSIDASSSSSEMLSEQSSSSMTLVSSSSSIDVSSSSSLDKRSSSSWSGAIGSSNSDSKLAWQYLNSSKTYGEILDTRDGQVYKTIEICDEDNKNCQTWMAENLNYAYTGVKFNYDGYISDSTSWCYDNNASNCATYGRLYTWAAAVDSVAIYKNYGEECGYGKSCPRFSATALASAPVRGVCPSGWHLPSDAEWSVLYVNDGKTNFNAGQELKAYTSLWSNNTGTNVYGFSVLPGGDRYYNGNFYNQCSLAFFWSSTENENYSDNAWYLYFYDSYDFLVHQIYEYKYYGFSVRCLKD